MSRAPSTLPSTPTSSTRALASKTNIRYWILVTLFVVTTINYVDRATLSMAAPMMGRQLKIDAVAMGYVFAAFGWSYAALQIPGGWLLDRFGSRLVYGVALLVWSLLNSPAGNGRFSRRLICVCRTSGASIPARHRGSACISGQ